MRQRATMLVTAGVACGALALLDPTLRLLIAPGVLLAIAGGLLAKRVTLPILLAVAYAIGALAHPEFRGDSGPYYAYLRSAAFDHDLDFANEWATWGYRDPPVTETGRRRNVQSVGPALLWSPFFAAAHLYVLARQGVGGERYAADGYSAPYVRATAVGTITIALAGAWLLGGVLKRDLGPAVAALATATALLASPVVYYVFVVPTMAHGLAFGLACAVVWAWDRARRQPSLASWAVLGAAIGLLALVRWQGAVYVVLAAVLAIHGLLRHTVRPLWVVAAAAVAVLAFTPQMLTWHALFGRWLTMPQGSSFVDWSSPHLVDTLFSADHGLFAWTPALLLGFAGLWLGLTADPLLHGGSLIVFAATAWVNGGVRDWAAGDAFGARRFDLVVPLLAIGLGTVIVLSTRALARWPIAGPAAVLAALALWNVGFIAAFRLGQYPEMAPLDRLARDQARGLRHVVERALGSVAGARGRALAYKYFVGEYFYTGFNRGGTIDLWNADERYLLNGWSSRSRRQEPVTFRWALQPEACVRLPFDEPVELAATITARAATAAAQPMELVLNGTTIGAATLTRDWVEIPFVLPARRLVPGENTLCLKFGSAAGASGEGQVAAAVSRIQLP